MSSPSAYRYAYYEEVTGRRSSILTIASLILCSCSSPPPAKPEPKPPPEPITARTAFQRVFGAARAWATDAQIYEIRHVNLRAVPTKAGKAGAWLMTFVSPSRGRSKNFTYSVVEAEGNIHEGVFQQPEEAFRATGQTPFLFQALRTDSDAAYETAVKRSEAYIKKNPDKPVNLVLQQTRRHPNPVWRVYWGDSIGTSNYSVLVNASTGAYVETLR